MFFNLIYPWESFATFTLIGRVPRWRIGGIGCKAHDIHTLLNGAFWPIAWGYISCVLSPILGLLQLLADQINVVHFKVKVVGSSAEGLNG